MCWEAVLVDLSYQFNDPALRTQALRHRSAGGKHYERLEFLGDGALNFIIAQSLYQDFPEAPEGDLSRYRARLVSGETLAQIAAGLHLGQHIQFGSGELKSGGHRRESILADVVEALIGAVYLDGGFEPCRDFVLELYADRISSLPDAELLKDPKTRLQEFLQGRGQPLPAYTLARTAGADHAQTFWVECHCGGQKATGKGTSRRKAEQASARKMLVALGQKVESHSLGTPA